MDFHPFLVHFPISLFFTAFLFEILRHKLGWIHENIPIMVFILATIFSIPSSFTGDSAKLLITDISEFLTLLDNHETMGSLVTLSALIFSFFFVYMKLKFPMKRLSKLKFAVFLLITLMVFYTGFLGGKLVQEFGVGVKNNLEKKD